MATDKFVPQLWSAKILEALDKELVYAQLFNTDYEGEITDAGDTVHIGQVGAVTIKDYKNGTDIDAADEVSVTDETLVIDQAKYFNVGVSDVDAVQSKLNLLDAATERAGYGFSDACDQFLANTIVNGTWSETPTSIVDDGSKDTFSDAPFNGESVSTYVVGSDPEKAYKLLVQMNQKLNENNVPKAGRTVVVPPAFESLMLLDSRFVAVGTSESEARLTEGTVYKAAGMLIKVSNNCPVRGDAMQGTYYPVIATSAIQGTFAQQILKTEAYRPEKRFGDAVKGLHVYGAKVLRPEAVAIAYVSFFR